MKIKRNRRLFGLLPAQGFSNIEIDFNELKTIKRLVKNSKNKIQATLIDNRIPLLHRIILQDYLKELEQMYRDLNTTNIKAKRI